MIHPCNCEHKDQDAMYGKGNRVMNLCKKGSACRCTVCKKEFQLKSSTIVSEVKVK
jgi:hypothetical protein